MQKIQKAFKEFNIFHKLWFQKSSEIKIFDGEETNFELDNININEIDTDFFLYEQKNEEEMCFNELNDLIKAPKEIKKKSKSNKIKRSQNPLKAELEMMQESYFDELIQDFQSFYKNQNQNNNSTDEEEKKKTKIFLAINLKNINMYIIYILVVF